MRLIILVTMLAICLSSCTVTPEVPAELFNIDKTVTFIEAFRPSPQAAKHDPSNIIRYDNRYWVFYTYNIGNHKDISIYLASSVDGYEWTDLGQALGCGPNGSWDESGTIAPYVAAHNGQFYLFYTGFRNGDLSTRELGCAIADSPLGPWKRWPGNPVLRQNPDPSAWDSGMLGDSNVIFRQGKWWLYFKSRRNEETSKQTHIGVAFANEITGPYTKYSNNPLFAGHAFSAWVHRSGVAAICGVRSPKIKWSQDGINFVDGFCKVVILVHG